MREYFYAVEGVEHGPCSYQELLRLRIPRDAKVWYQGLGTWIQADKLPALKEVPLGAATGAIGVRTGQSSDFNILDADFDIDGRPKNYRIFAICILVFSLITCSIFSAPFAITTLVFSTQVDSKYNNGFFLAAENISKYTKIGLIVTGCMLASGLVLSGIPYLFS